MNSITLNYDRHMLTIIGGPYHKKPDHLFGVKLAEEISRPCDVDIPIRNFYVPLERDIRLGMRKILATMVTLDMPIIYAGCLAGVGRTGLFMACMAKVFGYEHPVAVVRRLYMPHAVETERQMSFIEELKVDDIQGWLKVI